MRIAFYAMKSGLANNGGTNTIVRTAHALRARGHEVDVLAMVDSYTRFEHLPIISNIQYNYDIVCAVSYMDVEAMHIAFPDINKFWWMRLWDSHRLTTEKIYRLAKMQTTIVNASWMSSRLRDYGVNVILIPQGIDFNFWKKSVAVVSGTIGALYRSEPRKRYEDIKFLQCAGINIKIADNLNPEELRDWYSNLDYFIAPAEIEGLPNTPMEAALCGAAIVCRKIPMAGCHDFADDESALLYHDILEVPGLIDNDTDEKRIRRIEQCKRNIKNNIGTRELCAQKLEKVFSTYA